MAPKPRQSSGEENKPDTYRSASDKTAAVTGRTMAPKPRQSSGEENKPDTYRSASDKTGAVTGRTMYAKSRPSDEQKARQVRLRTPEARNSILDEVRKRVIEEGKSGLKKGGNVKYNFEKSGKDVEKKGMKEGSKADMALDKKQMMKMGGMSGTHKMPDGKRMKNSAMKMGGMPMKDGKPAFMMGKKMNMGGMAKYAAGGNINAKGSMTGSSRAGENTKIQKKGLTEGRIIRMASGGSVSSASRRADGIAQRGKTRC